MAGFRQSYLLLGDRSITGHGGSTRSVRPAEVDELISKRLRPSILSRLMNRQQPFQQRLQQLQVQRIRAVGLGIGRVVVNLQKQPVDPPRHRRPPPPPPGGKGPRPPRRSPHPPPKAVERNVWHQRPPAPAAASPAASGNPPPACCSRSSLPAQSEKNETRSTAC